MVTSPDSFFSREYSANFVITDEGREALHRNLVINEGRDEIHTAIDTLRAFTNHNGDRYHHGQWEPAARDATALSRACSRTQIQDNGGVLSHENTFTLNDVASSAPTADLIEQKEFDWYGGCQRCYQFSMLFGNTSNDIGKIEGEEDFEKYKMQFVDHYNEKHKDLYEWRRKKVGKKPITSQKNIDSLKDRIPYGNVSSILSMSFFIPANGVTIDEGAVTVENIGGVDVVRTPQIPSTINMTIEETHIITILEASGQISPTDQKRLEEKYGRTLIQDAIKKYRINLLTRNGFRAGRAPRREPFGRSMFHNLVNRNILGTPRRGWREFQGTSLYPRNHQ